MRLQFVALIFFCGYLDRRVLAQMAVPISFFSFILPSFFQISSYRSVILVLVVATRGPTAVVVGVPLADVVIDASACAPSPGSISVRLDVLGR